jgi:hypothetical protein
MYGAGRLAPARTVLAYSAALLGVLCWPQGPVDYVVEGRHSLRIFNVTTKAWTTLPQQLFTAHWYPTQVGAARRRALACGAT